jgi:hypothetical protein
MVPVRPFPPLNAETKGLPLYARNLSKIQPFYTPLRPLIQLENETNPENKLRVFTNQAKDLLNTVN